MGELNQDRMQLLDKAANGYLDWNTILSEAGCKEVQNLHGQLLTKCPFHPDKRPSFRVVEGEGYYHCFSCGDAGSKLKLLFKTSGTSLGKAQFYDQFLKSNAYLQRELGFSSLYIDAKTLSPEFEKRRRFSAEDHIGSGIPMSVLARRVRKQGDTWERLVLSLSMLQSGDTKENVHALLCKGRKESEPAVPVKEMSLDALLADEGLNND